MHLYIQVSITNRICRFFHSLTNVCTWCFFFSSTFQLEHDATYSANIILYSLFSSSRREAPLTERKRAESRSMGKRDKSREKRPPCDECVIIRQRYKSAFITRQRSSDSTMAPGDAPFALQIEIPPRHSAREICAAARVAIAF